METVVRLKDGTEAMIRPTHEGDLEPLYRFFQSIPDGDKRFLRYDVSRRDVVEERFRAVDSGRVKRLVAVVGDRIAADGVLELEGHGWKEHVGELRLIVSPPYRRKGLGLLVARELYKLAAAAKVEEIVVKMMRPQLAARKIFRKLGFRKSHRLTEYVKDREGQLQDLIIMRCDLAALWRELEDYLRATDWQRAR